MSNARGAELAQDLDPLDGVDVGMDVADFQAGAPEILAEILRGLLGERGDQHPFVALDPLAA